MNARPLSAGPAAVAPIAPSCPACLESVVTPAAIRPSCGVNIPHYLVEADYGDQLIYALQHLDARRRLTAAPILGERRERHAIARLRQIAPGKERDTHLAGAAGRALATINGPVASAVLQNARHNHPVRLVRRAAAAAFSQPVSQP